MKSFQHKFSVLHLFVGFERLSFRLACYDHSRKSKKINQLWENNKTVSDVSESASITIHLDNHL